MFEFLILGIYLTNFQEYFKYIISEDDDPVVRKWNKIS